jgi:3-oxoacyl-[acyl-carrier-protein] synthase I
VSAKAPIFIADYAVTCALGHDREAVARKLFSSAPPKVSGSAKLHSGRTVPVGRIDGLAPTNGQTRTNTLSALALGPLAVAIAQTRERYGADRGGVVIGTSTSGIGEGGAAMRRAVGSGQLPADFGLSRQQLGDTARFVAELAGATGPCYAVSTACTSGGRAMAAGARLLRADLCDVVICGGSDSLCELTLEGFASLEALSSTPSNPMSVHRSGLNIGEGAAFFLLSREPGPWRLAGWGESADGHHMSAPDPSGAGAEAAIRGALDMAGTPASDVDFVHLHGTATPLNDAMEAAVVARVFGLDTPCASTKPLTGHTLGAAGAVQAALCLMAMERGQLPPHLWDGARDPELAHIRLAEVGEAARLHRIVSASYAFGGNNTALALETA